MLKIKFVQARTLEDLETNAQVLLNDGWLVSSQITVVPESQYTKEAFVLQLQRYECDIQLNQALGTAQIAQSLPGVPLTGGPLTSSGSELDALSTETEVKTPETAEDLEVV